MYDISARINLSENELISIDGGSVIKEGVQLASFSIWSNEQNVSYKGSIDSQEKCDVTFAIDTFISNIKAELESNPVKL